MSDVGSETRVIPLVVRPKGYGYLRRARYWTALGEQGNADGQPCGRLVEAAHPSGMNGMIVSPKDHTEPPTNTTDPFLKRSGPHSGARSGKRSTSVMLTVWLIDRVRKQTTQVVG